MEIDPTMLRLLWAVIEDMRTQDLLMLSDTALTAMLLRRIARQVLLSGEEVNTLYGYINIKLPLIREAADPYRTNLKPTA
jgi:hypothetical protein